MSSEIREPKKQRWDHDLASLPEHVIIDILARVPIGKYPKLCMVSKQFRSIVSSDELYARRISLGCTEACIYAVMHGAETYNYVWYVLQRKANGRNHRFVPIQSIPPMLPQKESFVSVGSKIYMLGPTDYHEMTRSGLTVNFRSQVVKPPTGLPTSFMSALEADVMDEKIYVLGNFHMESRKKTMLAFNRETRMWENEIKELDVGLDYMGYGFVAMGDKIYIRDNLNSFVYWPKQNKWERDEMLNSKRWRNASVVDDLLCYYDHYCELWVLFLYNYEKVLRSYDTKQRLWQVVNGVAEMFPEAVYFKSHTVSYGGKLAVFVRGRVSSVKTDPKQIWCAEVSLERRGGEIWGHVEWSDLVIEGHMILVKSLLVMV